MEGFDFVVKNIPCKPFRKERRYDSLVKLLLAMPAARGSIPDAFFAAVKLYNESFSPKLYVLVEWLADIVGEYNPREARLEDVHEMHRYMVSTGKYSDVEGCQLDNLANNIWELDTYGRVLPDAEIMEAILEFYLKKRGILG